MSLIGKILIQSEWLPDIEIDPNAEGQSSWIGRLLKPKVTFAVAGHPVILQPYGAPAATKWSFIVIALVLLIFGVILLIARK